MTVVHTNNGIDYFPFDVDFFSDVKIRKLVRYCGAKSTSILICLLCSIYKNNGYYILWDKDLPFVISDIIGVSEGAVNEVIKKALQINFFDNDLFKKYHILTSKGIQSRFSVATYQRKGIQIKAEYAIKDVFCTKNILEINEIDASREQLLEQTQKKEKERSKEKERKKVKINIQSTNVACTSENEFSDTAVDAERDVDENSDIDFDMLRDFFNKTMTGKAIPKVRTIIGQRKTFVIARMKEYGKEAVMQAILKAAESNFLNGGGRNGFIADFSWIFRPNNFPKVLEGNYDNRKITENTNVHNGTNRQTNSTAEQRAADTASIIARLAAEDDAAGK